MESHKEQQVEELPVNQLRRYLPTPNEALRKLLNQTKSDYRPPIGDDETFPDTLVFRSAIMQQYQEKVTHINLKLFDNLVSEPSRFKVGLLWRSKRGEEVSILGVSLHPPQSKSKPDIDKIFNCFGDILHTELLFDVLMDGELLTYDRREKRLRSKEKEKRVYTNSTEVQGLVEVLQSLSKVEEYSQYKKVVVEISTRQNISILEKLSGDMAVEKSRRERLEKELEEQKSRYERDCQSLLKRLKQVFPVKIPLLGFVEKIDQISQSPKSLIKQKDYSLPQELLEVVHEDPESEEGQGRRAHKGWQERDGVGSEYGWWTSRSGDKRSTTKPDTQREEKISQRKAQRSEEKQQQSRQRRRSPPSHDFVGVFSRSA